MDKVKSRHYLKHCSTVLLIYCCEQVPIDPARTGENDVNVALNNAFNYILQHKVVKEKSFIKYSSIIT